MHPSLEEASGDELLQREGQCARRGADRSLQLSVTGLAAQRRENRHRPFLQDGVLDAALSECLQESCALGRDPLPLDGEDVLGSGWMSVAGIPHDKPRVDKDRERLAKRVPAEAELVRQRNEATTSGGSQLGKNRQCPAMGREGGY